MISDKEIAENIARLIFKREVDDDFISFENYVFDGVRYITFTGMDNETFRDSYTWPVFMRDLLGMDDRKETWANPHFMMDWEAVKPYLLDCIDDDEKTPIVLSGHGVAGSVALIAGYYLTMHHKNLKRVVTFGAPPALNRKKIKAPFAWPLHLIAEQYEIINDPMTKLFRWTKYTSLNSVKLSAIGSSCGIGDYVHAMGIGDGGLL